MKIKKKRKELNIARYERMCRIRDIILSTCVLVFLSPFYLLVAVLIFLDDPHGSPIYSQKRCGKNGKEFTFYKFRSMCVGAEQQKAELLDQNEKPGPFFKMADDPRVTRIGHIIRRTSIDEMPQFFNVLKGDMSIVGPRPSLPHEIEQLSKEEQQRLVVTPGLTCYWQVQPKRDLLPFEDWMKLDLKYIEERSFWVDWKIIFQTIGAVVNGSGV